MNDLDLLFKGYDLTLGNAEKVISRTGGKYIW
jgi:hypothetical protein